MGSVRGVHSREYRDPDQAAPHHWISLVNDRCDLDLAFEALEGWDHFHTDTIRGRTRSLQLRPKEAWDYFERAEARADQFGRSLRNLLRRFYLKCYKFENAVLEESDPDGGDAEKTDRCYRELIQTELPFSEAAAHLRAYAKGIYLLHREDYPEAKKVFRRLLWDSRDRIGDEKTAFYFGAAVAHRAMGEEAEADREMENACLLIPALDCTFNMGLYAGTAAALLRLWEREEEAREWDDFMVRLKIIPKTVELYRQRSQRIHAKSESLNRVFLI